MSGLQWMPVPNQCHAYRKAERLLHNHALIKCGTAMQRLKHPRETTAPTPCPPNIMMRLHPLTTVEVDELVQTSQLLIATHIVPSTCDIVSDVVVLDKAVGVLSHQSRERETPRI
ncbi:hypothetical protein TcWFU_001291 [Taenia crassiceps]|uniref:Uncharacterized protein n=1 Tax=Taenia crassiceps TaxID=6207 RepID=A0ABR4Q5D1_9CEST